MNPVVLAGNRKIDLSLVRVMGIVNVTPDSFSDGGKLYECNRVSLNRALDCASAQVDAGAYILDIGGESTRPGARSVSAQEEIDRTIPLIELLSSRLDVLLSIDTSKPEVMSEAARAGAHLLNDVRALSMPGAMKVAADSGLAVCLMHMLGEPATMQETPRYFDVVAEVTAYLAERISVCEEYGLSQDRLIIDPGFGFGKTFEHNLALLKNLALLTVIGPPVLVGLSRKSTIGQLVDKPVDQRLNGSLAAAVIAAGKGARIVRTHDVAETVDALRVLNAVL